MEQLLHKTKRLTALLTLATLLALPGVGWGQTTLPVSRTNWNSTPSGWTDVAGGSYLTSFACSGSNGGKFDNSSQYYQVYFSSAPNELNFVVKSNNASSTSVLLVEESSNGSSWSSVISLTGSTGLPSSCSTKGPYILLSSTRYVRWTFTKGSSNMTFDDVTITASTGTPDIVLSDNGTQVGTADVNQGTSAHILHKFKLAVTTANASLTGMTCTTAGTYAAADITNLKVRYSADATLEAGDATLSTFSNPGAAGSKTFPSFTSQSITSGNTGYIFITADIASTATHNNTISVDAITTSNLTFASGNKTGSTTAGGSQTIKDVTGPTVSTYSPTDGNTAVTVNQNLVLTFNENIQKGTGNITIKKIADDAVVQTIDVTAANVTISGTTLTIDPLSDLSRGVRYYINIDATAVKDIQNNSYAGISNNSTWNFQTIAPAVLNVSSTNTDGTYKIGDAVIVTVTFNDNVVVTGSPRILLEMGTTDRYANYTGGTGTSVISFTYSAIQTGDNNTDLDYVATNSLYLNSGTINSSDAIAATLTLPATGSANSIAGQKAIVIDGVLPIVSSYSPADGNSAVTVNQNLILTFSENVKAGTSGSIVIYNSGGTVFESIPYNDTRLTFSTNTVTIDPDGTFAYSSEYYVQISNSAIADISGNAYAGITNATTWNFTTVCTSVSVFPYTQDFESVSLPLCWTEELVTGTNSWQFITGNGASNPSVAHGGTKNACLKNSSTTPDVTKLVLPVFDLSSISAPILSFWHTQALYSPDQDELRVYYKTTSGGSWILLATYTNDIPNWTRRQINLPNPGSTYFIAFEGTAKYGYGVCIDDITLGEVTGEPQNHISNLLSSTGSPAYSEIDLVWDDATGNPLPDGYLIKGSTVGFSSIANPIDGTEEADGALVKNVSYGLESYSFTNLSPLTDYYFKVFPYTNSGSNINFKTDGDIPETSSSTLDGPCLTESFDVNSLPEGWSQTSVTFTSNYAEFAANTGTLAMISTVNANQVNFSLYRTTNSTAKSFIVEVSTTSQSAGYTTVATYDHSNTTSGGTTNCSVDLSAFSSNSTIYIRFRKASSTTSPWRLDDVVVNCGELTIWKGTSSNIWETGSNWTNGTPSSGKSAKIENVSNDPVLASSVECFKLTINSGSELGIASTGALKVNSTLTNDGGEGGLVIESGGSLLHNSDDVQATFKREIASDNKWHFLSVPINQAAMPTILDGNFAPLSGNFNQANGETYDFYKWSETNQTLNENWINLKNDSWGINTSAFGDPPRFEAGKGYLVAYNTTFAGSTTKSVAGELGNGSISIPLTAGGNTYNFVGNPYPSSIDWKASSGWLRSAITEHNGYNIWIWNDANGQYGAYNSSSGDNAGTNGASRYIAPGQAFFVKTASAGTLGMTNEVRVHSSQNWLKSAESIPGILRLLVTNSANSYSDEIMVEFGHQDDRGGTEKFYSFYPTAPNFYSIKNGNNLSINFLSDISENQVIPLGLIPGVNASYTINVSGLETFNKVTLEDKQTGSVTDLKVSPTYNFSATVGDDPNRFLLHFSTVGIATPETSSIQVYTLEGRVYVNGAPANAQLSLTDITGRLVQRMQLENNGLNTVNVGNLPHGVYVVTVNDGKHLVSHKIIL